MKQQIVTTIERDGYYTQDGKYQPGTRSTTVEPDLQTAVVKAAQELGRVDKACHGAKEVKKALEGLASLPKEGVTVYHAKGDAVFTPVAK